MNSAGIAANRLGLSSNSAAIRLNTEAIGLNAKAINSNTDAIDSLRDGASALAAIPDLYLGNDETWSIAGGIAGYDDGFGRVQVGFGGGIQLRGSTSDNWSVGVAGAVSGGAGAIRLQGRIGG